jgi:hypothetical protein
MEGQRPDPSQPGAKRGTSAALGGTPNLASPNGA